MHDCASMLIDAARGRRGAPADRGVVEHRARRADGRDGLPQEARHVLGGDERVPLAWANEREHHRAGPEAGPA